MGVLETIDDKVAGPSRQFTIIGIKYIKYAGLGYLFRSAKVDAIPSTFFDVFQLYKVGAKTDSRELSAHYGVCESHTLTNPVSGSEDRKSVNKKIKEAKKNSKDISQFGFEVKLVDDITFKPKMEELTDYVNKHSEGLIFNMRARSDGIPNNLLQEAYKALPK